MTTTQLISGENPELFCIYSDMFFKKNDIYLVAHTFAFSPENPISPLRT